jgi:hypothetical protein
MGDTEQPQKMKIDSEDLGVEMDKMDAEQRGKKTDVDLEKVERDVAAFLSLAKAGEKQQAIDGLLTIEKQGRLAEDISSTKLACRTILTVRTRLVAAYFYFHALFFVTTLFKFLITFFFLTLIADTLRR